jgi:hypothetical protein
MLSHADDRDGPRPRHAATLEPPDLWIESDGEHGGDEHEQQDVPHRPRRQQESEDRGDRQGGAHPVAHRGETFIGHLGPLRELSGSDFAGS